MSALFALLLGLSSPSVAEGSEPPSAAVNQAEYVRLQQELEKLAARNAWSGVERTYRKLVATGVAPSFKDHVAGAYAARALGDMSAARARLSAANALQEDKQVLEWLWDIDTRYGRVYLACDGGKHSVELAAEAMPFNPDLRRSVEFAIEKIAETCEFDGLLPHGQYTFGGYDVKVQRVQAVRLDLRNMELPTAKKRKKKQKKRKGEELDSDAAATE